MPRTFRTYRDEHEDNAPAWLLEPYGSAFLRSLGGLKDKLVSFLRSGVRERFVSLAPSDALPHLAWERRLPQGTPETEADWRARLKDAWALWEDGAGTPLGILRELTVFGYPTDGNVWIYTAGGRAFTLDGDGELVVEKGVAATFDLDGWNRFFVYFGPEVPDDWSGGIPEGNSLEADRIRAAIRRWMPRHVVFEKIVIQESGSIWGEPLLEWGAADLEWNGDITIWPPTSGLVWGYPSGTLWGDVDLRWGIPSTPNDDD